MEVKARNDIVIALVLCLISSLFKLYKILVKDIKRTL